MNFSAFNTKNPSTRGTKSLGFNSKRIVPLPLKAVSGTWRTDQLAFNSPDATYWNPEIVGGLNDGELAVQHVSSCLLDALLPPKIAPVAFIGTKGGKLFTFARKSQIAVEDWKCAFLF
jgi:hypothetical protein